jgi:hypothetical protein
MHVVRESQSTILHKNTRQKQTPNFSAKLKIFRRKDPCRKKKQKEGHLARPNNNNNNNKKKKNTPSHKRAQEHSQ